jgi:rare lipoprotein A
MKFFLRLILLFVFAVSFTTLPAQRSKRHQKKASKKETSSKKTVVKYGLASFYAKKFHGRKTASGETHSRDKYTAACNALPLNTWVRVTNLKNNRSIVVKINDRLNPRNKRLIDLSRCAAEKLKIISAGIAKVKVEVLPGFKHAANKR